MTRTSRPPKQSRAAALHAIDRAVQIAQARLKAPPQCRAQGATLMRIDLVPGGDALADALTLQRPMSSESYWRREARLAAIAAGTRAKPSSSREALAAEVARQLEIVGAHSRGAKMAELRRNVARQAEIMGSR